LDFDRRLPLRDRDPDLDRLPDRLREPLPLRLPDLEPDPDFRLRDLDFRLPDLLRLRELRSLPEAMRRFFLTTALSLPLPLPLPLPLAILSRPPSLSDSLVEIVAFDTIRDFCFDDNPSCRSFGFFGLGAFFLRCFRSPSSLSLSSPPDRFSRFFRPPPCLRCLGFAARSSPSGRGPSLPPESEM
jgi:hypothetical protein